MTEAGGAGFGDPKARDPAAVAADVAEGFVSREAAEHLGMTYDQFRHHYKKYGFGDPSR